MHAEEEDAEGKARKKKKAISAKKLILGWVNASLPDNGVRNLTTDWRDGRNLSALVDYCKPGLIPEHASLDPNNGLANVTNAMNLAEENFGIPQVMHPEDLAVDKPDELSVMTYLSYFSCPDSIGQNSLLYWIQQRIPKQNISNLTTDWADGRCLGALTDVISGGGFPEYEDMDPAEAVENCAQSMDSAEQLLSVERTISPDIFAKPELDQLTRSTYLTQFRYAKPSQTPAQQLTVSGPGIKGDLAGRETNFLVRGRVPEWAKLDVAAISPSGDRLPVKHHSTGPKSVSYQYTPAVAGSYTVEVKLNNEHIPHSPFSVTHRTPSDASACTASGTGLEKARVGEEAEFSVNCEKGGPGDLQVEISGPTGNVGTAIHERGNRDYCVKFNPLEVGPHTVSVLWDGKPVHDSPFTCLVSDPKKCIASGPGLTGTTVGEPQHFTVKTDRAGPGTLGVDIAGPLGSIPVDTRDDGNGVFAVTYVPTNKGDYSVGVTWSGAPVTGSPFKVHAAVSADPTKCTVRDLPTGRLHVGTPYNFTVDASNAGSGQLTVAGKGQSLTCEVVPKGDGVFEVTFVPRTVGPLDLSVKYEGSPIPDSPLSFVVNDPSKCKFNAAALAQGKYQVKQPIDFRVNAQFAGEGDVTATVRGPMGSEEISVKEQGDRNFLVGFTPSDGGTHSIEIDFDGVSITEQPVDIFVEAGSLADNVIVTQPVPGRLGAFIVEHPYVYKVNTAGAGDEDLSATGRGGRTGCKPKIDIVNKGDGQYEVTVTASEPDDYQVNITWGDDHVPGSSFLLPVEDKPRPDRVVCTGPHYKVGSTQPVTLDVNAEKGGAGELSALCYGDREGSIPVEIKEEAPKRYTVSFNPPSIDTYSIQVLWSDENVKDSPFKANLIPPDASKCIVDGPVIPLESSTPVTLHVDARDAGNGALTADAIGESAGPAKVDITEVEPNVFDVLFYPPTPDNYDLNVFWGGQPVPGAPFPLNLQDAKAHEIAIAEAPTAMLEAGQAIGICFDTSKGGRGELVASCKGSKVGDVPVSVTERPQEKYDVKFVPPEPDVYDLEVLWGGKHVRGSPFTINLMPVDIDKVKVIGPTLPQGITGPVEVMLKTEGAGKGKVSSSCLSSSGEDIPVTITETSADCYLLTFQPPKPDMYVFAVQFGGQNVKGSPFRINTMPPDAGKVIVTEPTDCEVSKPLSYHCNALHAGAGKLSVTCRGEKYGAVQVDIDEKDPVNHPAQFDVSFTPHHPDVYSLSMEWAGQTVPGSPFKLNLMPADADKVKVGKLHIPYEAGTGEEAWVDLDCSRAGHGVPTGKCRGDLVGDVPVQVEKLSADNYRAKFQPTQADVYHFDVFYSDSEVPGSPFNINLVPPQPDKVDCVKQYPLLEAGAPIAFDFDTSEAGNGELTATARGESAGLVPITVKEIASDKYNVSFNPPQPDLYTVEVYWADFPVKNSPFCIDTRPKVHPELVECGEPIVNGTGKPTDLAVDTSAAGPGELTASCVGNSTGKVPVDVAGTSPTSYNVSFVPPKEDLYSLSVFYDDTEVKNSPFLVDTRPKGPVDEQMTMQELIPPVESGIVIDFAEQREEKVLESVEKPDLYAFLGEPMDITIDTETEAQKAGVFSATAVGEKVGHVYVEATTRSDGSFGVLFNPTKPDRYKLDVTLGGKPVPNSPFYITYQPKADASKCRFFGLENIPAVPDVNEEITFGVDAKDAGDGTLSVTADGPAGDDESKLWVTPSPDDPHIYKVTYIPTAAGQHRVHAQWSKEPIPDSPLVFDVGDASSLQSYTYGAPVAIDIAADCKSGDLEAYGIHEDTGTQYKVKIAKAEKGKFKLSFQPKEPGIYAIHVLLRKREIPGSPFRIRYSRPPNPGACVVSGLGNKAYVGEPVDFTVDVAEAGSGDLHIKASGPTGGKATDFIVKDNKDDTYSARYVPKAPGNHQFQITWADESIPGSPFVVSVEERETNVKTPLRGDGTVNFIEVGQPVDVCIANVRPDAGDDCIAVECTGKLSGEAKPDVSNKGDGCHQVRFCPSVADDYKLDVKFNGEEVEGSPFLVRAVEHGTLSPDYTSTENAPPSSVEVGTPVNVVVRDDATGVAVATDGPIGPCETSISDSLEGSIGVGLTPDTPGDYLVHVKRSGSEIGDSPYKISVTPKDSGASRVYIVPEDMNVFKKSVPFGKGGPARFRIATKDAGPGTLNITSKGPGKAEIKIFSNQDGTYSCEFIPSAPGKYHINVMWNDEHIPGSPFVINFKSKKSRMITGLNLEDENFRIKVPHRFKLHCEDIGEGILEITCSPPTAANIKVTPISGRQSYQCEILPLEVGNREIKVQYNGKNILGSPFHVYFDNRGDASKCKMIDSSFEHKREVGDHVTFVVSTEGAGKGKLSASVEHTHTHDILPVSVTQATEHTYNVEFSPGDSAEYLLSIQYDEQHILGSPFKLVFNDASQCHAEGEGLLTCKVEQWSTFDVSTENSGPGDLKVVIEGDGELIEPTITEIETNKYQVRYLPLRLCTYSISVLWGDANIPESPFEVQCYNSTDASFLSIPEPVNEVFLGSPLEVGVKASRVPGEEEGSLTATLQTNQNRSLPATVSTDNDNNYVCRVEPPATGKYMMHVRWNGEHVSGSPFKVKVMSPPKPENIKAYGPGLQDGIVGQEGNFTVETGEGGAGTLAVRVHGPKGAFKINMRRHPDNERTILVRYDPNIIGVYTVDVTWADVHVPGSPFNVNISAQQENEICE